MTEPHFGYMRIVEAFDKNETAGSFLREDGEGGFASGVYRMADEIDALRARAEQAEAALAEEKERYEQWATEIRTGIDAMKAVVDAAKEWRAEFYSRDEVHRAAGGGGLGDEQKAEANRTFSAAEEVLLNAVTALTEGEG